MWFPAEKPSSAGRVVNHNIGDGHIFMANFQSSFVFRSR
jgi:hypothetical protein